MQAAQENAAAATKLAATAAQTLEHAKQAADAEIRPWIAIDAVMAEPVHFAASGGITMNVQLRNVGNVPATNVIVEPWLDVDFIDPNDQRLAEAYLSRLAEKRTRIGGRLLVPHEPTVLQMGANFTFSARQLEQIKERGGIFTPLVTMVAFYKSARAGDATARYTIKTFQIMRQGPKGSLYSPTLDAEIPAEELALDPALTSPANRAT